MDQSRRSGQRSRGERPALDPTTIEALALHYAGRYMTTRARLAAYLTRKLRERGGPPDGATLIAAIVERMAALGYVDDATFAAARAGALERRGYGARRVDQALRVAGVDAQDRPAVDQERAWPLLLRFARRRRFGPFGARIDTPAERRRQFAAILRAGHDPQLAGRLLALAPGEADELI